MFTRIFTSISLIVLVAACSNPEKDSHPAKADKEKQTENKSPEQKKEEPSYQKLTDDNAEQFLRKYAKQHDANKLKITTRFGDIVIKLYQNAPLHRANMLYLTERNYFNGTWFYRVSEGHVIQAGNNDETKTIKKRRKIGDYEIPAEQLNTNYHLTGAVAAARSYNQNPSKASDPYEFYITLGQTYTLPELNALAKEHDLSLNAEQKQLYQNVGGAPHLDGEHTVFGKVVKGMDVVREINKVKTDDGEWPLEDIPIKVEVVK